MITEFLDTIAAFPLSAWLRTSFVAYPLVSALHILGAGGLVTLVWLMHWLGREDAPGGGPGLARLAAFTLAIMALSGLALFSVRPTEYAENPAFLIKMALISIGIANIAVYYAIPTARRAAAVISACIWPGVLVAGRFIGFV